MAYTIKQARPVLLNYLGLTEENANYIESIDISISHVKEYATATALVIITN